MNTTAAVNATTAAVNVTTMVLSNITSADTTSRSIFVGMVALSFIVQFAVGIGFAHWAARRIGE